MTKFVAEIYAKATPLPQQAIVASPILVESTEKAPKSGEELDALKLQLEALNHALQEKDNQIAYLMNRLDSMTGKS
ncbi:hypothetical protein JCGZ_00051 [Jatropha curcas]|uniref:Uncharacterized protein n=1 Tax=Jatropha curcas TaxID=180498 RepID=A0A067LQF0_JATCU|nr:hypothetical protein JCGZ_00051 [Jatropha curcas]